MRDEDKTKDLLIAELNELRAAFGKLPQPRQIHRLEKLGALTRGMCHDLNNILGAIIGYAEIMELFEDSSKEESKTRVRGILRAAYRGRGLVEQLHLLSRQTEPGELPGETERILSVDDEEDLLDAGEIKPD